MHSRDLLGKGKVWKVGVPCLLAATFCLAFGCSAFAQTPGDTNPNPSEHSHPLQGEVQHDETLPPIAPQYSVGNTLDPGQLTSQTPNNRWFPIPAWFAGTWHSDEQTVLQLHDYDSELTVTRPYAMKEISDTTYGMQRDKTGQVWHFIKVPKTMKQTVSQGTAYLTSSQEEPIEYDSNRVVIKFRYEQLIVSGKNVIESVKQVQSINVYTPMEDGLVSLHASLKSFDADGNPKILQEGAKMLKRTAKYADMNTDGDLNLKAMFAEYLKNSDQANLISQDGQ